MRATLPKPLPDRFYIGLVICAIGLGIGSMSFGVGALDEFGLPSRIALAESMWAASVVFEIAGLYVCIRSSGVGPGLGRAFLDVAISAIGGAMLAVVWIVISWMVSVFLFH